MIGAIGCSSGIIMFEVSESKLFTITDLKRSNSVRFAKHDVLQKKPVLEYVGPELDNITFKIILKEQFNVDPRAEMDKLIELQRSGETLSLVIGDKGFGVNKWVITSLKMDWEHIDNEGFLTDAACDITLQEYV